MLTMDKFDGDYDIGFDFDRYDSSFGDPAVKRVARVPSQNDWMEARKEENGRRSQRSLTKDSLALIFPQSRPGNGTARPVRDNSGKGWHIDQAESNLGACESTEVRNPLDIYCSEIRRLNSLNPEDEHRFQVRMSEVSDSLVRTISRFPGSARTLLEGSRKIPSASSSSQADRSESEFDYCEASSERRFEECPLVEAEDNDDFDARLAPADLAQGTPDSALIQALSACFDDLYRAARQHGIFHEITCKHRVALAEAFCKLPLTPLCIENLLARLDSLLDCRQQTRMNSIGDEPIAVGLAEASFEQLYAIGFDEFEQIAREASRLYREWQKVRNRIAEFHVGLVVYVARQYSSEPQELIDLIQEGNIGLIKAVERFKYRLGFRFSTYATYWIRLAMSRYLARSSRAVRLPYRQSLQFGTVRKKRENFSQIHGRAPSALELARATGISETGLRKLEIISQAIASLDAQVEAGENLDLMSMLEQQVFNQPFEELEKQNMNGLIEKAIGGLNQREAYVIRQRFGIGVYAEKTLQELGAVLGLTRERIRQIENGALKKIRRWLEPLAV